MTVTIGTPVYPNVHRVAAHECCIMASSSADLNDVHTLVILMVVLAGREPVAASGYHQGAGCHVPLSLPGRRCTIWLHHCAYLPQVGRLEAARWGGGAQGLGDGDRITRLGGISHVLLD